MWGYGNPCAPDRAKHLHKATRLDFQSMLLSEKCKTYFYSTALGIQRNINIHEVIIHKIREYALEDVLYARIK